ncbi:MAG: hypothetical protein V7752_16140 [Halopseudomonas sp.]
MKFAHILAVSTFSAIALVTPLQASEGHAGESHSTMAQNPGGSKMFLEKRDIDGYTVSFHVMEAAEGMRHGGSHNLMVKVEKGANAISEIQANSKVVYPDGKEESKPLMKMGDWYMAGYDLQDGGKNQVMVLFKTPDGKKHFGGVHYTK